MKRYILIFIISFIVFLGILGGGYLYLNNAEARLQDPEFIGDIADNTELVPPESEDEVVINTLLLGVDEARSDTMIVARYNKETHQIAMMSIPRDTRVDIPGYGYTKINAAVGKKGGTALAMKTVSNLLDIPIHHYVKVDFKGVEKIVDLMGGVKINVPKDMYYVDPVQNLYIDIKKGEQVLKGKQALHFLRYRSGYIDQDLGRIKAQQDFAKAFIDKLTSPAMIPKAISLLNTMVEYTKTNLEQEEITAYALDIGKIDTGNIKMYTLPGEGGNVGIVAYFLHDEKKLQETMAEMNEYIGAKANPSSQETSTSLETKKVESIAKEDIKIEILNSTSTKGLASTLKGELQKKGFEVQKIGDTKDLTYSYSRVIDRRGNQKQLELVAEETGINVVDSDINPSYAYDITIIKGNDRK
ncbi:MAG TPA: LCP family protein [Patescibacteria group bacterium]|nr:LCP family protein [Patescibacteria group bacterium]